MAAHRHKAAEKYVYVITLIISYDHGVFQRCSCLKVTLALRTKWGWVKLLLLALEPDQSTSIQIISVWTFGQLFCWSSMVLPRETSVKPLPAGEEATCGVTTGNTRPFAKSYWREKGKHGKTMENMGKLNLLGVNWFGTFAASEPEKYVREGSTIAGTNPWPPSLARLDILASLIPACKLLATPSLCTSMPLGVKHIICVKYALSN